jgi:hypothetical protein
MKLMKMNVVFGLMVLLSSAPAFAGSFSVQVKCKSQDGLLIEGFVPGDPDNGFALNFTLAGKKATLFRGVAQETNTPANASVTVVEDYAAGVWVLHSEKFANFGEYGFAQIYALPGTLKFKAVGSGYKVDFTGKTRFELPAIQADTVTKKVACTLEVSI